MFRKSFYLTLLLFISLDLSATKHNRFLCSCYKVKQGKTVRTKIKTTRKLTYGKVTFLSKEYPLHKVSRKPLVYETYIPIECEGKTGLFPLTATIKAKRKKPLKLRSNITIQKRTFPKQKGFKVSATYLKNKVEKEGAAIKKKTKGIWGKGYQPTEWLYQLLSESPKQPQWKGKFILPTKVNRYSTPFGEIRFTQSWGRYLHTGVDIVAPPRYPVKASQNGKIIVQGPSPALGNHIVIDHGAGVFTYYLHLEKTPLYQGKYVKKGEIIGTVGNTGFSTGYHLHWGLSVQNQLVDPIEWTTTKFN